MMQRLAQGICRYCLRFLLFYWICFFFPFPLDLASLPFQLLAPKDQPAWLQAAGERYSQGYSWIHGKKNEACEWVGEKILDVKVIIQPTGSGDTMRAYVGCLCAVVVAPALALLWSVTLLLMRRWSLEQRADGYLLGGVNVLVRFFLMQMLFSYGFAKVFPLQFAPPSSFRLTQQLGDMSPMGLLWTFMGFSTPYQIFTGAVEVLGGLLLICRRTTVLGAMVTLAAMTQVFVLNMCFDVPVKLYSFHYLAMAFFLLAPELPRLASVLVLGRAVEARPPTPILGKVWIDRCALAFRTLLVTAILYTQIQSGYKRWLDTYGGPPAPVLGRWEVLTMKLDEKDVDKGEPAAWSWLDFSGKSLVRLSGPKPPALAYRATWNPDEKKLTLAKFRTPEWSAAFTYELPEPDQLVLRGSMDGKAIVAKLRRAPEKQSELMSRGFHWIQEMPYNR